MKPPFSIYLAHAIDKTNATSISTKECVKRALRDTGAVIFDPATAFVFPREVMERWQDNYGYMQSKYISDINLAALLKSDLRVFIITDVPSWGVPIELGLSALAGLPFILLDCTADEAIPVYLRRLLHIAKAEMGGHSSLEDLIDTITKGINVANLNDMRVWSTPYEGATGEPEN